MANRTYKRVSRRSLCLQDLRNFAEAEVDTWYYFDLCRLKHPRDFSTTWFDDRRASDREMWRGTQDVVSPASPGQMAVFLQTLKVLVEDENKRRKLADWRQQSICMSS